MASVESELAAAREELPTAGRGENALTKLFDSRVGNVLAYLSGQAGPVSTSRRARPRPWRTPPRMMQAGEQTDQRG